MNINTFHNEVLDALGDSTGADNINEFRVKFVDALNNLPPGEVDSVNGQQGTVVLDAGDVGAAAEDVLDGEEAVEVIWTTADPSITPDGSVTIANGGTPTVEELQHFCVELNAKLNAIIAALS